MYPHHERALESLKAYFSKEPGVIAVIFGGSVAKGLERPDSDIDAMVIVTDERYEELKAQKVKVGCAISPDTPWTVLDPVLPLLDMVLVMTVYPGFGGQNFIEPMLQKVWALRRLYPELDIQVDGGINEETVGEAIRAGANVIVMGTAFFGAKDPGKLIRRVREMDRS